MRIFRILLILLVVGGLPTDLMAQSGMRYSILVAEAKNASEASNNRLRVAWADIMTGLLAENGKFIVVGSVAMREDAVDEQDIAISGLMAQGGQGPSSGKMTSAQLLLYGTITYIEEDKGQQGGGINLGVVEFGGKRKKVEIGITVSLVDSTTGQVVASTNVKGLSESRSRGVRVRSHGSDLSFNEEENDNLVDALANAGEQAIEWLSGQLTHVRWSGKVLTASQNSIIVDRGSREGVRIGQVFRVGKAEVLRSPDTGEILDESLDEIARLEVTEVRPKVSYCRVLSGDAAAVHKGLTIQLP